MHRRNRLQQLSNRALDDALTALVATERACVADILAHLAEVDVRKMYLAEGYSSLYRYATEHLRMTCAAAGHRITAARLVARFPEVYDMVASGALHMAGLKLLSPHLTRANCQELLAAAAGKSKRAIEELLAARYPRSDVLPLMVATSPTSAGARAAGEESTSAGTRAAGESTSAGARAAALPTATSVPLSADSFAISFTIDRACKDKLTQAQALLSHRLPGGDPGAVMSLALDALLTQLRKQRFAVTAAPRAGRARKPGTRYVPAADKREVWERDGERCAFVSEAGHRCTETRWLELHHVAPHARGGAAVAANLQVMCRMHNAHLAEVDFGVDYIKHVKADAVHARRAGRATSEPVPVPADSVSADSVPADPVPDAPVPDAPVPAALIRDATSALRQLGFSASVSRAATAAAAAQLTHTGSLEQLIRDSLRRASALAMRGASAAREPIALYEHQPRGGESARSAPDPRRADRARRTPGPLETPYAAAILGSAGAPGPYESVAANHPQPLAARARLLPRIEDHLSDDGAANRAAAAAHVRAHHAVARLLQTHHAVVRLIAPGE